MSLIAFPKLMVYVVLGDNESLNFMVTVFSLLLMIGFDFGLGEISRLD